MHSLLPPKRINRRPPLQHRQANSTIKRRAVTRQAPTLPLPPPQKQRRRFPPSRRPMPPAPTRRPRPKEPERTINRPSKSLPRHRINRASASLRRPVRILGRSHSPRQTTRQRTQRRILCSVPRNLWIASPIFCERPSTPAAKCAFGSSHPRWEECRWTSPLEAAVSRPGWKFRRHPHDKRCSTIFPCCTPRSHRRERRSAGSTLCWHPNRRTTRHPTANRHPTVSSKPVPKGILKADRRINRMGKSRIRRPRSISSISKFEQAQSPNLSTARAAEPFPKLRKVRSATF